MFVSLSIYGATALLLGLGRFFSFLISYILGRFPWTGDQPVARPLPVHRTAQTQNKRTQTSMRQVGFEPMIPVFERAKTVLALDRAATVTGCFCHYLLNSVALVRKRSIPTERPPLSAK
jgi:hypothetical protein